MLRPFFSAAKPAAKPAVNRFSGGGIHTSAILSTRSNGSSLSPVNESKPMIASKISFAVPSGEVNRKAQDIAPKR